MLGRPLLALYQGVTPTAQGKCHYTTSPWPQNTGQRQHSWLSRQFGSSMTVGQGQTLAEPSEDPCQALDLIRRFDPCCVQA